MGTEIGREPSEAELLKASKEVKKPKAKAKELKVGSIKLKKLKK